jgi:hypothetical protein
MLKDTEGNQSGNTSYNYLAGNELSNSKTPSLASNMLVVIDTGVSIDCKTSENGAVKLSD